jgi:hypothetical protein
LESPDGVVDAIVVRTNSHATVPFVDRVFIVPRRAPFHEALGTEVLRADRVRGGCLVWARERLLLIEYERGRVFHFSNFWTSRLVENFSYVVTIELSGAHLVGLRSDAEPRCPNQW